MRGTTSDASMREKFRFVELAYGHTSVIESRDELGLTQLKTIRFGTRVQSRTSTLRCGRIRALLARLDS